MKSLSIRIVEPNGGEWLSFNGLPVQILLDSEATGGRTCFNTGVSVPDATVMPHRHGFAEAFYLLEGEIDFQVGDTRIALSAGDFIHIPPGVLHQPINRGDRKARLLTLCVPAGFDGFQRETGVQASGPYGPFATTDPSTLEKMRLAATKYGIEFDPEPWATEGPAEYHVTRADGGESTGVTGDVYRFLATSGETKGEYAIMHAVVPPGGGPPPHRHSKELEVFYILKGEMTLFDNGSPVKLGVGGLISLPEGSRHWFRNETGENAEMLIFFTPGGLENMFREAGTPSPDGIPQPPQEADIARLVEAVSRYGIELG